MSSSDSNLLPIFKHIYRKHTIFDFEIFHKNYNPQTPKIVRTINKLTDDRTCPVPFIITRNSVLTICNHEFDKEELELWLANHNTCPICKHIL